MLGVICGKGLRSGLLPLLAIAICLAIDTGSAASDEPITVPLDQAKILKAPDRTGTLVVGNPLIADVAVQPSGLVVITGKSYGLTNMIALDRVGEKLAEYTVQVVGPLDSIVVVYRGVARESYSCVPSCARRITIGDEPAYFGASLNQAGELSKQAQNQSQQQKQ